MEINDSIFVPKKRRSLFTEGGDAASLNDSKLYSPAYRTSLENEIELWTQQIHFIRQESEKLLNVVKPEDTIKVNRNIFSREELDFFDHSLYYEYLNNVSKFCNKIQCVHEIQKQKTVSNEGKTQRLHANIKYVEKQIRNQLSNSSID